MAAVDWFQGRRLLISVIRIVSEAGFSHGSCPASQPAALRRTSKKSVVMQKVKKKEIIEEPGAKQSSQYRGAHSTDHAKTHEVNKDKTCRLGVNLIPAIFSP